MAITPINIRENQNKFPKGFKCTNCKSDLMIDSPADFRIGTRTAGWQRDEYEEKVYQFNCPVCNSVVNVDVKEVDPRYL